MLHFVIVTGQVQPVVSLGEARASVSLWRLAVRIFSATSTSKKGRSPPFELLEAIRELLSQSPLRPQPAKAGVAPAWIPRSMNGYFALTCHDCLRSFSVLTRDGVIGKDAIAKCSHCGVDVNYHIDDSVLPVQDDLRELIRYPNVGIASQDMVRDSKRLVKSVRHKKS